MQVTEPLPYVGSMKLNLAIGPDCPVRCEGCYNVFGDRRNSNDLVSASEVIAFAEAAAERDIDSITLSGGDPLHHPEIVDIVNGLRPFAAYLQMDTVGTAFLGETAVLYKGVAPHATVPRVDLKSIASRLDLLSLPLDTTHQSSLAFRKGRPHLFEETLEIARLVKDADVSLGINTVVTAANIARLLDIREVVEDLRASAWQLFQYDPLGPNPSLKKDVLQVSDEQFIAATKPIESEVLVEDGRVVSPWITVKSLTKRIGDYVMIDATGLAHHEELLTVDGVQRKEFRAIGHIVHDKSLVIDAIFTLQQKRQDHLKQMHNGGSCML